MITVSAVGFSYIKAASFTWVREPGTIVDIVKRGIQYDRQWLVVGENNMFVAQRQGSLPLPQPLAKIAGKVLAPLGLGIEVRSMCQVMCHELGDDLVVWAPGMGAIKIPLAGIEGPEERVQVWRDNKLSARDQGPEAAEFFTQFLSRERPGKYRFMRMTASCQRVSKAGSAKLGFHDAFPFMAMSEASLENLNALLQAKGVPPVPMDNFRPNFVLSGLDAHEEDHLGRIRINGVVFEGKTLCSRCSVICTNQETGERHKEPLTTLASYRRGERLGLNDSNSNKVFVGRNFDHKNTGFIKVGDEITVELLD